MSPVGNFKNKSVDASRYAMVPAPDIPRSAFFTSSSVKTTFDGGRLVPIYIDEVLPGDSHSLRMTAFVRLGTLLYPLMDNLHLDTFFFFVPNRLVWSNWVRLMGERPDPTSSIGFANPVMNTPIGGFPIGSLGDYFGLPTEGQVGPTAVVTVVSLPIRMYALIWNEWFRDQNLQSAMAMPIGDGPDPYDVALEPPAFRNKRPDYFTTCLPWPQKPLPSGHSFQVANDSWWFAGSAGGTASPTIYGQVGAPVSGIGAANLNIAGTDQSVIETGHTGAIEYERWKAFSTATADNQMYARLNAFGNLDVRVTVNALREAFQIAKLTERDARGGTRYTEMVWSHFRVRSPDSRLQRPEYLGGGTSVIHVNPVAQQSGTGATGTTTPLGHLSAVANGVVNGHGFSQSFTEHGFIIGLANVRADLSYQQGMHRMWFRRTRFDHYFPVFANLNEQAVLVRELYTDGSATDGDAFGFQERWAEYRSKPGLITGRFRSTATGTLDAWHLAQRFVSNPGLSSAFITDTATRDGLRRVLAAGAAADGQQILFDGFFDIKRVRAMPTHSVPGLVDHF